MRRLGQRLGLGSVWTRTGGPTFVCSCFTLLVRDTCSVCPACSPTAFVAWLAGLLTVLVPLPSVTGGVNLWDVENAMELAAHHFVVDCGYEYEAHRADDMFKFNCRS